VCNGLSFCLGASNWLTTLPLNEHRFALHKYGLCAPALCACGSSFSVEHVLSCPKLSLRHNEIRDLTATLLTKVFHQVCVEPELQPVDNPDEFPLATSNTQEGVQLDVVVNGFWASYSERCFVDVCIFLILCSL